MKTHTSSFKEQIKLMGKEIDSRITFGDTVLGKNELNAVTPSFQSAILKSVMKQLDIDSNVAIPIGTILTYEFGLKVNGEYEYLNFGNYIVKSVEKQEDTKSYKITCYDMMLLSMKDYVKMPITYPITIREYIDSLCTFLGLRFANANDTFANYDKIIPNELYLDSEGNSIGYTFRDVFDELAQVTASTICINENDEIEVRYINDTGDTIDEEFLKDVNVNFGEKFGAVNTIVLSRAGGSDKIYESFPENLPDEEKISIEIADNQIMNFNNRDEFLPEILGRLNGLEYYLNDFSSTGITYYDICDRYNVKVGDNTYSCVMFNDEILVTQGLQENVFTEMPQETQTDYTKADKTDRRINQTYLIVDKQNQTIESVVSQTTEQNEKIAKVTQTVEELNSKISDIADITISAEDTDAKVELDNINQSEPIRIVVRAIGEDISYLYPRDNLFPSDDLYLKNRIIRFENKTTGEIFDYELPDDLLYYGGNYYDEFILDYDGQSCVVNKNVAYNPDGTKYLLRRTEIINYEFPTGDKAINLTDGDYVVSLPGYSNAYLFVRLMAQNIYTTQFATRAELNSEISQTARDITLRVSETYATKETTNSLSTRIKQTAKTIDLTATDNKTSAGITIKLKNEDGTQIDSKTANITMSGLVKFTDLSGKGTTEINGANITTGTLDASKVNVTNLNADNIKSGTISTSILGSDVITTKNFSAQKINADNITTGTLSCDRLKGGTINGQTISGGTISGSKITSTSGNIGGFIIDGSSGLAGSYGTIRPNGNLLLYPNYGSARYVLSDKITFNAQGGVVIASNSNANVSVYNTNLDLKACAGAIAYLGCMGNTDGTDERSAVECGDRTLYLRSDGVIYANGAAIGGSSSKNTKTNIVELSQEKKDELYKLIKDIPLCEYDYKPQYGKENNYGFLIEDIEETKLNDLLHITKVNEDIKTYCSEDLTRLNLIIIKELMNKVESLENRIKELESDK